MGRTARDRRQLPHPRPVQKIELSNNKLLLRGIAAVVFLVIGAFALSQAVSQLFSVESGWQTIEAVGNEASCASELVLVYDLGSSGLSASAEARQIRELYSGECRLLYQLFHTVESFEGVTNLRDINLHPNETLTVDGALYRALETVQRLGDRTIYLGPVYARYNYLFFCEDDARLADFDPWTSKDVRQEYETIAAYARDPASIDLQLLGEGQVRLFVSEEYLAYAQQEDIERFLDFGWLQNAFVVDEVAAVLTENGFTRGAVSSCNGFNRNLDDRPQTYSQHVYDSAGGTVYPAAVMAYEGPMSLVTLYDHPINEQDAFRVYSCEDGSIRTDYLSVEDGRCRNAVSDLLLYSETLGCAETAMRAAPVFIADTLDTEALGALAKSGIQSVYCEDRTIYGTDAALRLTDLFDAGGVRYTAQLG